MPGPETAACPACSAPPGSLSIVEKLVAKPLGTWSLSGAQVKTSAYAEPVLTCSACGMEVVGRYDADGRHATFDPTRAAIQAGHESEGEN